MKTERLTEHLTFMGGSSLQSRCYNKLRDLEDIEEELGIDLVTLFKAIQHNAIYDIEDKCYVFRNKLVLLTEFGEGKPPQFVLIGYGKKYYVKDYGKTWALTRKELDK